MSAKPLMMSSETLQDFGPQRTLYERDLALWFQEQQAALEVGDCSRLDVPNLIEELNGLAGRDRRELKNCLQTAFEHMLELDLMPDHSAARGWQSTVRRSVNDIADLLEQSPSLRNVFTDPQVRFKSFRRAMRFLQEEYGDPQEQPPASDHYYDRVVQMLR